MKNWESEFQAKVMAMAQAEAKATGFEDPAHDLAHFARVVSTAKRLAQEEGANLEVVIPAAWLHDLVNVPKNDPRRSQASRLSADEALRFLKEVGYPEQHHDDIRHAIEAHSYSAGIQARTLEAKVVQDADRLDGLGAVGIARVFIVGGLLKRRIYDPQDPFAANREWNDLLNTVDHFHVKLFRTAETMQTRSGREEARRRADFMRLYLEELQREIGTTLPA